MFSDGSFDDTLPDEPVHNRLTVGDGMAAMRGNMAANGAGDRSTMDEAMMSAWGRSL